MLAPGLVIWVKTAFFHGSAPWGRRQKLSTSTAGPLPYARYSVSQLRRPHTAVAGQERRRDAVVVFRVSFQEGVHTPTTVRYAARATNDAMNNPTNSERSPRVVPPPIHSAHCIELVWLDGKATGFLPIAQQEASPRQESVAQNGPKR